MKILVPENNLAGFLTAVYHAYYTHKDADTITSDSGTVTMLDEKVEIETDLDLARRVRSGITKKAGSLGYRDISDAYLSCDDKKEQKIFKYLKLLFKNGRGVYSMFAEPDVIAFNDILNKVRGEVHRFHGFLRFQEMANGTFYSCFSGDNDIIELLVPHFKARFNNQKFVLHDIKRQKLVYFDGGKCHYLVAPEKFNIILSEDEVMFSELWRQYHKNVSIESRKNLRQQRQFLPKKYRWFMNEF